MVHARILQQFAQPGNAECANRRIAQAEESDAGKLSENSLQDLVIKRGWTLG